MTQHIPDGAVERACVAYVEARFDLHHDIKPTDSEKVGMRAALEASGALFLTDEERRALAWACRQPERAAQERSMFPEGEHALAFESVREKLQLTEEPQISEGDH